MSLPVEMIWVDYEGTGVHEEGPVVPLEIGIILTDRRGYEVDQFESLILVHGWQSYMNRANDFVKKMHTASGLVDDLQRMHSMGSEPYRTHGTRNVQGRILDWLANHGVKKNALPMTGSSVHYDRRVAQEWMPDFNGHFHYRNQDVSSIKNFCKLLNPDLAKRLPKMEEKTHRPIADLRNSIREYRWYCNEFLIVDGDKHP